MSSGIFTRRKRPQLPADGTLETMTKANNAVIANQPAGWCGDPLNRGKTLHILVRIVRKSRRLPRQCAMLRAKSRLRRLRSARACGPSVQKEVARQSRAGGIVWRKLMDSHQISANSQHCTVTIPQSDYAFERNLTAPFTQGSLWCSRTRGFCYQNEIAIHFKEIRMIFIISPFRGVQYSLQYH